MNTRSSIMPIIFVVMVSYFELDADKQIYFASDLHLGAPNHAESLKRERLFCNWLDKISSDAQVLYIVGDLFDFWFEYKHAVPKGFVRILGKLAEMSDSGIKLYFFPGNHDLWVREYLSEEIGFEVCHEPVIHSWNSHRFYIGHGDGLGPGDNGYKILKKVFLFKPFQWAYRLIHPDLGIGLASWLSKNSRARTGGKDIIPLPKEEELLYQYASIKSEEFEIDTWVFGHRHLPMVEELPNGKQFINLGDWITHNTWASFSEKKGVILHR